MKFLSPILTACSGSVGGAVYSHNKGGMYVRNRNIPPDKRSPEQLAWRAIVGALSNLWITLTAGERASWSLYASNVPRPDRLGQQRSLSAQQHFFRSNALVFSLFGSEVLIKTAPSVFDIGLPFGIESASGQYYGSGGVLNCKLTGINDVEPSAGENNFVFLYCSPPEPITHTYRRNPLRYTSYFQFTEHIYPEQEIYFQATLGFSEEPSATWLGAQVLLADGRLSQKTIMRVETTPSTLLMSPFIINTGRAAKST